MSLNDLYELFLSHPVITTDTRNCPEGSIFFALKGDNFDGNLFAHEALAKGCAHAVVDNPKVAGSDGRMVYVSDVLLMLQELAHHHRKQLTLPVIQITGTNGKTTTKELTSAVLAKRYNVLFTEGNFNNHIGVPKTLLRLTEDHQIAVIETGANHPGEIADLSKIVDADCGLITNVGKAHLEGFGSLEGVVQTKGELYKYLAGKPEGFIFLNADNSLLTPLAKGLRTITYGKPDQGYDVEGEVIACTPQLRLRLRIAGGNWQEVQTQLVGAYNLDNMLAAAAVGLRYGVSEADICSALEEYTPKNKRSELQKTERNTLIVDAYNANPTSMKAALENFQLIPHPNKLLILGEMRELGQSSAEEHKAVVALLQQLGFTDVWLVGNEFASVATETKFRCFENVENVKEELTQHPLSDKLILVKGSNGTKLFQLPEYL
ncbi:MAG: UDP-N-acetylmuramoyl-tripeptide--D-alanyl-D-alanine ligase [Bacteroidaceae bacterium]|nr:UDP-N-acetylmuramoyl-tripeptide--D-alanyl-D-alanine ligase [Bacteroidaceae bacterium]